MLDGMGLPSSSRFSEKEESSGTEAIGRLECYHSGLHPAVMRTVRYVISGRVQGVGFRYFVQSVASRESLAGWVRNLDDGRVETAAAGDADAIERFERAIRQGPAGARVDHVAVDETFPMTSQAGFHIR
jgi:acylphosphatase